MSRALCVAVLLVLLTAACGGGQPAGIVPDPQPLPGAGFTAQILKDASGAPRGVRVKWNSSNPAEGYRVYRSDAPIPDASRGDSSLWTQPTPIPNPGLGADVTYDDLFAVALGQTWFYRLSAVDADGDESDLSPESQITISDFRIDDITATAGVSDSVIIVGEFFGSFDPVNDAVHFPGVEWVSGTGLVPVLIPAAINTWTPTTIDVTVPQNVTRGPLRVTVGGLSQDSSQTFTNSDPYIESISPLSGDVNTPITITGNHFMQGVERGTILHGGVAADTLPQFSNTSAEFLPNGVSRGIEFDVEQPVVLRKNVPGQGQVTSNTAFLILANSAPVASFAVLPPGGETPLDVTLDATATLDADGQTLIYEWDFEDDGTVDHVTNDPAPFVHTFLHSGSYVIRLTVTDTEGSSDTAIGGAEVDLSQLELVEDGSDPAGQYYQTNDAIMIHYELSGGEPDYSIDWYLVNSKDASETLLDTETDVTPGDGFHFFLIDSATTVPVAGSDRIPRGSWQIRAVAHDGGVGNDPDPAFTWPLPDATGLGTYEVGRARALVVQDNQGDPLGNESRMIHDTLLARGYDSILRDTRSLTGANFIGRHLCVWAADGPHGQEDPYEWLSPQDLSRMKQFANNGGYVFIFGPPAGMGTPFPQDAEFNDTFQPFIGLEIYDDSATFNIQLLDDPEANVQQFDAAAGFGHSGLFGLVEGPGNPGYSWSRWVRDAAEDPPVVSTAAMRRAPGQGAVFIAPFVLGRTSAYQPAGSTREQLLDECLIGVSTLLWDAFD
jgi:PKD repeat protein